MEQWCISEKTLTDPDKRYKVHDCGQGSNFIHWGVGDTIAGSDGDTSTCDLQVPIEGGQLLLRHPRR